MNAFNDNNGSNDNNDKNKKPNKTKHTIIIIAIALIITYLAVSCAKSVYEDYTTKEITYSRFLTLIDEGKVDSVEFTSNKIIITPVDQPFPGATYYTGYIDNDDIYKILDDKKIEYERSIDDTGSSLLELFLVYGLPFIIVIVFFNFMMKRMSGGGGIMGVGKSNAKVYVEKKTGVTFKDVAGQDEAKESMTELVDFLHNPGRYTQIGAKLPKGALLVGPPGTGKTLLAKAVAGEANVPFFSLSGSDFVEMFVGVGASRVRDLFKQAQQSAPCIIFIDEIDAIGKSRDSRYGGGNDEREQTLNQLLAEMDGFDSSKGVLILAATNRPEVLDKALLRPGRFDRRIIVDKPDLKGRLETLKVHSKDVLMDDSVDLDAIALATAGAVGSDLANIINEAAINAVKNGRSVVSQGDLFESVEVVIAGKEKKDRILGKKEKKMVAYHEVGHALITLLMKDSEPVQKITIVPRTMGALGYTMQVPEEEKYLMTKAEMEAKIVTLLGGRAAEEVVFDTVTTGASNDIERATKMAKTMVSQYGMSDKIGLMNLETVENAYLDGRTVMNCSEKTAAVVDEEVQAMLKKFYEQAKEYISENQETLDKVAEYLIQKETITGKEFLHIYHEVKGISEDEDSNTDSTDTSSTDTDSTDTMKNIDDAANVDLKDIQTAAPVDNGEENNND